MSSAENAYADASAVGDNSVSICELTVSELSENAESAADSDSNVLHKQTANLKRRQRYRDLTPNQKRRHNAQSKRAMKKYRRRKKIKTVRNRARMRVEAPGPYTCNSTLSRAANKVISQLPSDGVKRSAVLNYMVRQFGLLPERITPRPARQIGEKLRGDVKDFYLDV
jgi:hypothetical protein